MNEPEDPKTLVTLIESGPDDPLDGLAAVGRLRQWLEGHEGHLVSLARREGLSWHGIGNAVGRSKQAMWERYHGADPQDTPGA